MKEVSVVLLELMLLPLGRLHDPYMGEGEPHNSIIPVTATPGSHAQPLPSIVKLTDNSEENEGRYARRRLRADHGVQT
jgi:hypothetical protein